MSSINTDTQEIASTHPYTCNTCQVAFRNSDLQRGHMRSDWHRYNLKRRVTSLPPIPSDVFTEKVLQAQAQSTLVATKAAFEKTCNVCEKTYFSDNALRNHLGSQRHKERLASTRNNEIETNSVISSNFSLGEPMPYVKDVDFSQSEAKSMTQDKNINNQESQISLSLRPIQTEDTSAENARPSSTLPSKKMVEKNKNEKENLNRCLFCNLVSQTVEMNTSHMEKFHGMFLPERKYLVDLQGLLSFLYERIYTDHQCLYCGKIRLSKFGIQTHMRDKDHCKIPFFTENEQLEIGDFYDFTSTYSDFEFDAAPNSASLNKSLEKSDPKTVVDNNKEGEDDGWETDNSESTVNSTDIIKPSSSKGAHQEHKLNEISRHSQSQSELLPDLVGNNSHLHKNCYTSYYSDYELYLPSGRIAGHRLMNKYFKQNLHNSSSFVEKSEQLTIEASKNSNDDQEVMTVSYSGKGRPRTIAKRTDGGLGMTGISLSKKKEIAAIEKRSRFAEERGRRRSEWIVNKQKNSQKHFRVS
ncbi:Cytoplasmic 60S subunit biogenesis factor REI1-like protein [Golovinomyces cichoracearum]|uniref:Cytoplasmic 60S subunit biogenesis factor REI1-like protein n=1 Tax=Golovinomyces cichoracearum TaxID=62708 RepID=A0A420IMJ4_9PEZI|nr:Cytoplasmic 60S subunit biogenesis factor REI1-like protein [Golovinomyces cichoracearum]